MTPLDRFRESSPFIVALADKDVIDGHGGIWTEKFTSWLSSFVARMDVDRPSMRIR